MLLLLSSGFALIFLLDLFTLRTRVVLNSVLFLELLLPDGTNVEFVAHGTTAVHYLLRVETSDKLQQFIIVGGEAVIVVICASDAPSGRIDVQINNGTTSASRLRIFLALLFLRFGLLLFLENPLQFEA